MIDDDELLLLSTKENKSKKRSIRYWLAPEVWKEGITTKESDVFSFGIILWQLLSRKVNQNQNQFQFFFFNSFFNF